MDGFWLGVQNLLMRESGPRPGKLAALYVPIYRHLWRGTLGRVPPRGRKGLVGLGFGSVEASQLRVVIA